MTHVVIVGAGQAGAMCATQLRATGFEGKITMYGDEIPPPYERPPLSKAYLLGELPYDKLLIRPESFYAEKAINLCTEQRVESIDTEAKTLSLTNGTSTSYDKLLLATGARPRLLELPGSDLQGVHYLRTLQDVQALQADLVSASNICLIGGGYVGLELASVAAKLGLNVTILESADRLLKRVTTQEMSDFYSELHQEHGVNIFCHSEVLGIDGDGRVQQVRCRDRVIPADIVLIGIGAIPNTELAEAAGLDCSNGISVDAYCETSATDVFAAGDCTNHPNKILGRRLRLESAPNAIEQARVAAANIQGQSQEYASVPWFWSDQYNLKLQMVGFASDGSRSVCRGDKATHSFAVFHFHEGRLVAVEAVNDPQSFMIAKRLYGKVLSEDEVADTSIDLKKLVR